MRVYVGKCRLIISFTSSECFVHTCVVLYTGINCRKSTENRFLTPFNICGLNNMFLIDYCGNLRNKSEIGILRDRIV